MFEYLWRNYEKMAGNIEEMLEKFEEILKYLQGDFEKF